MFTLGSVTIELVLGLLLALVMHRALFLRRSVRAATLLPYAVIHAAPAHLRPGGWLGLEHGWDQGPAVRALLGRAGFQEIASQRDSAGHVRVSVGRSKTHRCPPCSP